MSQHLHLRAFTGRPAAMADHVSGHGVNPASQPYLSLVPALTLAMSYERGEAYRYAAAFEEAAASVWSEPLATRLRVDLMAFQDRGRDRLTPERRAELRDIYAAFDHPAGREVVAWLDGAYEVGDEVVETQ
jgi:hypothetical protein